MSKHNSYGHLELLSEAENIIKTVLDDVERYKSEADDTKNAPWIAAVTSEALESSLEKIRTARSAFQTNKGADAKIKLEMVIAATNLISSLLQLFK